MNGTIISIISYKENCFVNRIPCKGGSDARETGRMYKAQLTLPDSAM